MSSMGPTTASTLASYSRTCSPARTATGCQGKLLTAAQACSKGKVAMHSREHWQLSPQRAAVTTAVSSERQQAAASSSERQ